MPSSMQMSRTLAPFSTCWRATLTASSNLPCFTSLANFGEPATLVRSPIMMKTPGCCVNGCEPERRKGRGSCPSDNSKDVPPLRGSEVSADGTQPLRAGLTSAGPTALVLEEANFTLVESCVDGTSEKPSTSGRGG